MAAAVLAALAQTAHAQGPLQFEGLPRNALPAETDYGSSVVLVDVDDDGDLDLVVGNRGQNRLYLNDGSGAFSDVTANRMPVDGDATRSVTFGDVDGDGDLDLVLGNGADQAVAPVTASPGQQNRLYLNDGTGTFTDDTAARMPVDADVTGSVVLGDVDGDGDLDLLCSNVGYPVVAYTYGCATCGATYLWSVGQQNRLYLNDGTGHFTDATVARLPIDTDQTASIALGDVDGDGDLDLLLANTFTGGSPTLPSQDRLYLNSGLGTFVDSTSTTMPLDSDRSTSVDLGDVDGDGDLDLVIGNTGQSRVYLNDGAGTFSDETANRMPTLGMPTRSMVLADIDGDSDLDVLLGNRGPIGLLGPQPNRLYLNDGAGVFADVTASRLPLDFDRTYSVALGDVDGDGDIDAVLGNGGQDRLLLNVQRQLHAPMAPQIGQPYSLDAYLRYGPPSTVDLAAIYLSTAPASIALAALGTLGIDLSQAAPFPTLAIPQPAGVGSVGFTVPNVPALTGQELYSQALLVAYPNDLRLSNVVCDVIQ